MSLLRRVDLPPGLAGSLWLSPMPGRFESWPNFVAQARRAGIGQLVCLTPRAELTELSPAYDAAVITGELPFRWVHLPMRNFGLPEEMTGFRDGIAQLAQAVTQGDAVLLHCAAGIGRTGSAAACVLKALGLDTENALELVRQAGSNPQNAQQSGLVGWF